MHKKWNFSIMTGEEHIQTEAKAALTHKLNQLGYKPIPEQVLKDRIRFDFRGPFCSTFWASKKWIIKTTRAPDWKNVIQTYRHIAFSQATERPLKREKRKCWKKGKNFKDTANTE